MSEVIDADTLRRWLDEGRPVTVLDIRTDEDWAQWAIPGSVHVNAYESLRAGQLGPLGEATFPPGRPVVTVCNRGQVSQTAAEMLARRGLDARSLAGGMKAWSVAWNTAEVPIGDANSRVIQVRRTGKGCLSYIIGSDGDAIVIDASLPAGIYAALAAQHGWRIRYVLESHIHADQLSRAREVAERSGATLLVPTQGRATFPLTPVSDGDRIVCGRATLRALHTPGHTAESTSYLLNGEAVFTGDTLFVNGVGRPDLHAEGARQRSTLLFRSLTQLSALGPHVVVLPAHASEPVAFDGKPVCARLDDAATWLREWMVSERTFVERVVARLPPTLLNALAAKIPDADRIVLIEETSEILIDKANLVRFEARRRGANRRPANLFFN